MKRERRAIDSRFAFSCTLEELCFWIPLAYLSDTMRERGQALGSEKCAFL